MKTTLAISLLGVVTAGSASSPVVPKVKGTPQLLGLVRDAHLNRDSCGSANFGDRTFWTCRDTQLVNENGSVQQFPVISSTASYTNLNKDGTPDLLPVSKGAELTTTVLRQSGNNSITQAFFPVLSDECTPPTGECSNGSRYAIWPDSPPMVASKGTNGAVVAYTWIKKSLINSDLSTDVPNPATSLYRVNYNPTSDSGNKLPSVTVVKEEFYAEGDIPFGDYGNVVVDGVAYLYGQANNTVSLAKVPVTAVEDISQYKYYVNNAWTSTRPSIGQAGIAIANASAGGQGTYYYSEPWKSYVWIGGNPYPGATFYITTAPAPQGPWIEPVEFYTGVNGNYSLSAYSLQANPALITNPANNSIFLTYTKNDLNSDKINVYSTPLVYVEWE